MTKKCPAAAYIEALLSAQQNNRPPGIEQSSSMRSRDFSTSASGLNYTQQFLRDMVCFMYRCHDYVKKYKEAQMGQEPQPGRVFAMTDKEKQEHFRDIVQFIIQKEGGSKAQMSDFNMPEIYFDPGAHSTPVTSFTAPPYNYPPLQVPAMAETASQVSGKMAGVSRSCYTTPTSAYSLAVESQTNSTVNTRMAYVGSCPSTGRPCLGVSAQTSVVRKKSPRICGRPGTLDSLGLGLAGYDCPYKLQQTARSAIPATAENSYRGYASTTPAYQYQYYPPSPAYQDSYVPQAQPYSLNDGSTAETSFYEQLRGEPAVAYYQQSNDVFNNAYGADYGEYYGDGYLEYGEEELEQEEYTTYLSSSNNVVCACR